MSRGGSCKVAEEKWIIGRKAIIQHMSQYIGCRSWGAVRNCIRKGMPRNYVGRQPYVVPRLVKDWVIKNLKREGDNG